MSSWLSNPKVRLGLIVNGLYLFSLFTPTSSHQRPHLFEHASGVRAVRALRPPAPGPEAPTASGSRTSTLLSDGRLHISLNQDLTLVKRPDRTLLLSPSFSARVQPFEEPTSVVLRFMLFSRKEDGCPGDCPLTIVADGENLWPHRAAYDRRPGLYSWKRESAPPSSAKLEDGRVVETMAAEAFTVEVPYDMFLDLIRARHVGIGLGPDYVSLTADQLDSLRDMYSRIPDPTSPDHDGAN